MFILFASPFFRSDAPLFLDAVANLPGVRLGIISQDPIETLTPEVRSKVAAHWRVSDPLSANQLEAAALELQKRMGRAERFLAINEQIQVPVAEVRQRLGIAGMGPEVVRNFRDKSAMKDAFRANGIPCARHCAASSDEQAWKFIEEVGFPVCVKPVDGAATQSTYRVANADDLADVLRARECSPERPLQLEEFVTGQEHSFEVFSVGGVPLWHSLTRYHPTPLDVMRNPWIQWRIILPREIDGPEYDDVRDVGFRALKALGMQTGMSHMEWFRRNDGSIAVSEIGCRPPGAQLITMTNRAHDMSIFEQWARTMVLDQFTPPRARKYAAGTAFLRGLGGGKVAGTHGLDRVLYELSDLITDYKVPQVGEPASITYEGEGWVILRHPETKVVEEALDFIVRTVRVEMYHR